MSAIIKRVWNQNKLVNIESLYGMTFQAEDGGHTFEISGINDANEAVSLSGTVAGVFMRPDGTDVALTGTASEGVVSVTLSDACYAVAGRFGLTIFVTSDSKKTCVYACIGTVAQTSYGTVAGDTPQDVVDLINAINSAIASIPADYSNVMAAAAPTYSDNAVYVKGAYAWYNGVLYKAVVDITTAESFTAAHWTVEPISKAVQKLEYNVKDIYLNTLNSALFGFGGNNYSYELGAIASANGLNTDSNKRIRTVGMFMCTAGTVISDTNNASNLYVMLYNMDGSYKGSSGGWVATYTIPSDCMVRISARKSSNNPVIAESEIPTLVSYINIAYQAIAVSEQTHDYSLDVANDVQIAPGGGWIKNLTTGRSKTFRIPKSAYEIVVTAGETATSLAFLKSYTPYADGVNVIYSTAYPSRIALAANEQRTFSVRGDMNYLNVATVNSSGVDITPTVKIKSIRCDDDIPFLESIDTESADETGKTDRADEITLMLSQYGKCQLGKGVFYVGGSIKMPVGTMLCGCGKETKIILLASVTNVSTIIMDSSCTVKDLTIQGASSTQWTNATEGTRNGIEWTGEEKITGTVDNVAVINFDDAGIYLHDTTQKTYRNLAISNCYCTGNYVGIDIRQNSEFNKITNCTIIGNAIGYRNRGGNNDLSNSGIDANKTGCLIDKDEGTNGGHGTITGCSMNHSNSNTGYGLIIKDTGRMLVTNCNIGFSKLRLENTNGNVISNCGFFQNSAWEIIDTPDDGGCNIFIACMLRGTDSGNTPITITNNTQTKIVNCFTRTGNAVTV